MIRSAITLPGRTGPGADAFGSVIPFPQRTSPYRLVLLHVNIKTSAVVFDRVAVVRLMNGGQTFLWLCGNYYIQANADTDVNVGPNLGSGIAGVAVNIALPGLGLTVGPGEQLAFVLGRPQAGDVISEVNAIIESSS
jgi:hypothetical protein